MLTELYCAYFGTKNIALIVGQYTINRHIIFDGFKILNNTRYTLYQIIGIKKKKLKNNKIDVFR